MECLLINYQNGFIDIINTFSEITNAWNRATNNYKIVLNELNRIIVLLDHLHKQHYHPYKHKGELRGVDKTGMRGGCSPIGPVDRLLREISGQFDQDDTKSIYGDDFIFSIKDFDFPRCIQYVQTQCEAEFGRLKDQYQTFRNYLNQFKVRHRCTSSSRYNPLQKLIIQAILGENPENIHSKHFNNLKYNPDSNPSFDSKDKELQDQKGLCSDLIYGVNFIIDPDDPDKPKELIEIEKQLNIPKNIKKIKYSQYCEDCIEKNKDQEETEKSDEASEDQLTEEEKREAASCGYVCTRLVGEWLHQVDIDHNGLIYGNDFIIDDDEPKKCRCLKELEQDIDWNPTIQTPHISWDEFCNTFPDKNPDDRHKK